MNNNHNKFNNYNKFYFSSAATTNYNCIKVQDSEPLIVSFFHPNCDTEQTKSIISFHLRHKKKLEAYEVHPLFHSRPSRYFRIRS